MQSYLKSEGLGPQREIGIVTVTLSSSKAMTAVDDDNDNNDEEKPEWWMGTS